MKIPLRAASVSAVAAVSAVAVVYWSTSRPPPAEELYASHCSACHQLPDFTHSRGEEMAGIVKDMTEHLGAADIITEAEALAIVGYLERAKHE